MRTWQVERRKRTRHLIELGGLVVKAGIVDLTGDDRATIYGALLWMADKLKSDQGDHARALWAAKGKQAFEVERKGETSPSHMRTKIGSDRWRAARRSQLSQFEQPAVHRSPRGRVAIVNVSLFLCAYSER